jgi:putative transcriptional regulator
MVPEEGHAFQQQVATPAGTAFHERYHFTGPVRVAGGPAEFTVWDWALTKRLAGINMGSTMKVEVRAVGLKEHREKAGLTQRELAKRLGVSQNYIPALEAGTRRPGPNLRTKLMQLFNCKFEDLFQVVMVNPLDDSERTLEVEDRRDRAG